MKKRIYTLTAAALASSTLATSAFAGEYSANPAGTHDQSNISYRSAQAGTNTMDNNTSDSDYGYDTEKGGRSTDSSTSKNSNSRDLGNSGSYDPRTTPGAGTGNSYGGKNGTDSSMMGSARGSTSEGSTGTSTGGAGGAAER